MRKPLLVALTLPIAFACSGGGGGVTPPPGTPGPGSTPTLTATVSFVSGSDPYGGGATNSFSPAAVNLLVGGTVTWANGSGVVHNVTFSAAAGAPADVPNHAGGDNARTFATTGTFPYACTQHFGMAGTVNVQ